MAADNDIKHIVINLKNENIPPPQQKKKRRYWLIILIVLFLGFWWCKSSRRHRHSFRNCNHKGHHHNHNIDYPHKYYNHTENEEQYFKDIRNGHHPKYQNIFRQSNRSMIQLQQLKESYGKLNDRYSEVKLQNQNLLRSIDMLKKQLEYMNQKSELFDTIVQQCNYMAEQSMYKFNQATKGGNGRKGRKYA